MNNNISNFVIYQSGNDDIKVDILVNEDTLWMTQKEISNLFDVSKSTISEHFSNIFNEQELNRLATVRKFRTVQQEGNIMFYLSKKAKLEYMEFNKTQKILSDFDKMLLEKKYE